MATSLRPFTLHDASRSEEHEEEHEEHGVEGQPYFDLVTGRHGPGIVFSVPLAKWWAIPRDARSEYSKGDFFLYLHGAHHRHPEPPAEFVDLVEQWRSETVISSSLQAKVLHPAYQRIMGMGDKALPWVLEELRQRPGHWFWALTYMAGEDAAVGCDTTTAAREAWLNWGEQHGYL